MERVSIRSSTGGMGRAGGEGEVHSPSSTKVSATTPSKGASRVVWRSWARARVTAESARSAVAPAARHAACAVRSWLSTPSIWSVDTIPCAARSRARSRSRAARSAAKQAWSRWASVTWRSSSARLSCARCSESSIRSSSSPSRTRLPRRWGSATTLPPVSGASFARRRALTVPAREFVTVSSTRPLSTATVRTGTASGAKTVSRSRTNAARNRPTTARRGHKRRAVMINPRAILS